MPSPHFRILITTGIFVLTSPVAGRAEPASEPASGTVSSEASIGGAGGAGSWVHVDPQTGQRVPGPARAAAVPPDPAFSTSHQGLVAKPAPGGGMMIDLQGRFRSAATATVDTDGTVHRDCVPPGTAARKE
jgi:hypothetical protein